MVTTLRTPYEEVSFKKLERNKKCRSFINNVFYILLLFSYFV